MAVNNAIEDMSKGHHLRVFWRRLSFASFGITAFINIGDRFNLINIGYGIVVGLLFGFLYFLFLKGILGAFNRDLKQLHGKKAVAYAVEKGMLFLIPFAVMALLAAFALGWSITGGFVSAALMTAGVSASTELGKLKGKQSIKNTILTSVISWSFATLWFLSVGFLGKIPAYLEGGINLLSSLKIF